MKKRKLHFIVFAILVLTIFVMPVYATPIIDFGIVVPTAGSISYAGGINPLVGNQIQVDIVTGLSTPLNDNVTRNLFGGLLNFTTGNLTGTTATTWDFGGGPSTTITLVGGVDLNGNGIQDAGDIPANTTLLTGEFGIANVTAIGGIFKITGGAFVDNKDPTLVAFYGLPNIEYTGNFNISFNAAGTPPSGFKSTIVLSGDVTNSPVPEPGTLLLLGSGLVGLFGYTKFRLQRRKN